MGWVTKELWFDSWRGGEIFLYSSVKTSYGLTEPCFRLVNVALSLTVTGLGYVADCLHASGVGVKNGPAIPLLLPYALMECTGESLPLLYNALTVGCIVSAASFIV
jgi:hypothetical protein